MLGRGLAFKAGVPAEDEDEDEDEDEVQVQGKVEPNSEIEVG